MKKFLLWVLAKLSSLFAGKDVEDHYDPEEHLGI